MVIQRSSTQRTRARSAFQVCRLGRWAGAALVLCLSNVSAAHRALAVDAGAAVADGPGMQIFLDRLMQAESAGRDDARNPRSTAVGPFQFIEATFLAVTARHFAAETAGLTTAQVLTLRTDRTVARRAAEAFTRDNAAYLAANGIAASWPHLRLAHLIGPGAAVRVLALPPAAPVAPILGAGAVRANPFLARLTVAGLVARSAREVVPGAANAGQYASGVLVSEADRKVTAAFPAQLGGPVRPVIAVRCNQDLPSCRRWVSLAARRTVATGARAGRTRVARNGAVR